MTRYRASLPAVLSFAWDAGVFRADNVIATLGLTRSTTLSALDELIGMGLIREVRAAETTDTRMGRPARCFELREDAGLVVGLDAGGRHFTAVVADLAGQPLATEHVLLPEGADEENLDPAVRQGAAFRVIDAALAAATATREHVVAVGVGLPAPVDRQGRSPATGFWQGVNANLHATLAEHFPVVRTENDASLAAVAEGSIGAARGRAHYVAMLSGRRLGSGIVLDGRLMRGTNGGIGEMEALKNIDGVGGAWGMGVLAERWVARHLADGTIPRGHPWTTLAPAALTAEAILAAVDPQEPLTARFLTDMGEALGRICNVLARAYDPELIIVCGAMAGALGEVIGIAQGQLEADLELPAPTIVASDLGGDVVSLGAVSAAREAARDIVLPLFDARARAASEASVE